MSKKLIDTDETYSVQETAGRASVPVDVEHLIRMHTSRGISKHVDTCPAAKAYQRMLGVAVAFGFVIGLIVWLGQNATEKKIDDAVESAFQKRLPYLRMMIDRDKQASVEPSAAPPAALATPTPKVW